MVNVSPVIISLATLRIAYTQVYERFCVYAPMLLQASDEQMCIYVAMHARDMHLSLPTTDLYMLVDTDVQFTFMHTVHDVLRIQMVLAPNAYVHAQCIHAQAAGDNFDLSIVQQRSSKALIELVQQKAVHMNIDVALRDCYAEGTVTIVACLAHEQAVQLYTYQRHEAPHTQSKVCVKTMLADHALYTHQGMLDVAADAHDVVAYEQSDHLLCDATARAYVVPAMQVRNNEVQCTHASAIGQFDVQLVWYICSRGLSEQAAHALLVRAYIASIVSADAAFAAVVAHIVEEHLQARLGVDLAKTEYV